jgi:hypothetical protein
MDLSPTGFGSPPLSPAQTLKSQAARRRSSRQHDPSKTPKVEIEGQQSPERANRGGRVGRAEFRCALRDRGGHRHYGDDRRCDRFTCVGGSTRPCESHQAPAVGAGRNKEGFAGTSASYHRRANAPRSIRPRPTLALSAQLSSGRFVHQRCERRLGICQRGHVNGLPRADQRLDVLVDIPDVDVHPGENSSLL